MCKHIESDEAMTVDNGVYKTHKVFEGPDGGLYIQAKGGFVRLKANGSTSHPSVKMVQLNREGPIYSDRFGRVAVTSGPERKPIAGTERDKVLGLPEK